MAASGQPRRSCCVGLARLAGMHGRAQLERTRQSGTRPYLFRGRIRCAICTRKMQGGKIRQDSYYRCLARTLAPGSAALAEHPRTVNLRESVVLGPLNDWLGELFAREKRDRLVAGLLNAQPKVEGIGRRLSAGWRTPRRVAAVPRGDRGWD